MADLSTPARRATWWRRILGGNAVRDPARGHVVRVASPWAGPSHLSPLPGADIFGDHLHTVTRRTAMGVPAIARARHLVAGDVARCPITVWAGDEQVPAQPSWIHRSDSGMTPWHRMLWTADDLIFYGWSCWITARSARGQILDATRLDQSQWEINPDDNVLQIAIGGQPMRPATPGECILIPGPHEGILNFAQDTIEEAIGLRKASKRAATDPIMHTELHYTGDADLTDDEIQKLINWWILARSGRNGGVGYTNKWTEVKEHGRSDSQFLGNARNVAAVECARIVGIPASMIDAVTTASTREYSSGEMRNLEYSDRLKAYTDAIRARLSEDDVVPQGHSVRFDYTELTSIAPIATGSPTPD